jgi:hypothetical protein
MGVFARIMMGLAAEARYDKTIPIDATYLKVHRTTSSLGVKGLGGRLIGRPNGDMDNCPARQCAAMSREGSARAAPSSVVSLAL